jgi:nucleotide-binding universal stress UspA family protein
MFSEILVPIDRSDCAESALVHAASIAKVFDSHVTVLHVMESSKAVMYALANPIDWQINRLEAETYLQQRVDRLHADYVEVDSQILEGDPAIRIYEYIRDHSIDLVVLSSRGQTNLAEWKLGSVTQKIVNMAQTSLLVVRPKVSNSHCDMTAASEFAYRRILLPLDASPRSECVLPTAIMLSQKQRAQVLLAHVVERPRMPRRTPLTKKERSLSDAITALNRADAEQYLSGLKDRFSQPASTQVLLDESASLSLHHLAEQEQCDLVMLSAHGHTSNMAWPYGSLAASFLAHSSTNVMIIQDMTQNG